MTELLVVMIIVGLLAAIAIPVFLSQQRRAAETSAKTDVEAINKEILAFYVDGSGTIYPSSSSGSWRLGTAAGGSDVASGRLTRSNAVATSSWIHSTTDYCIAVDPVQTVPGAAAWHVTPSAGLTEGTC